jgi:hypothetical protein
MQLLNQSSLTVAKKRPRRIAAGNNGHPFVNTKSEEGFSFASSGSKLRNEVKYPNYFENKISEQSIIEAEL